MPKTYATYGRSFNWWLAWDNDVSGVHLKADRDQEILLVLPMPTANTKGAPLRFTYADVRKMLAASDFTRMPGYVSQWHEELVRCLEAFITDVDEAHRQTPNDRDITQ